jgi:hypothetical protein
LVAGTVVEWKYLVVWSETTANTDDAKVWFGCRG